MELQFTPFMQYLQDFCAKHGGLGDVVVIMPTAGGAVELYSQTQRSKRIAVNVLSRVGVARR